MASIHSRLSYLFGIYCLAVFLVMQLNDSTTEAFQQFSTTRVFLNGPVRQRHSVLYPKYHPIPPSQSTTKVWMKSSPSDDSTSASSSSTSKPSSSPLAPPKKRINTKLLPVKIVSNFFYVLTAPFPDLRRVLLRSTQQQGSSYDEDQTSVLPLRTAMLAVGAYLCIGVLSYHFILEKWSIVDALYFSCVCFSTVGYGDLCPTTPIGKMFTCLFGFSGIALLGAVIATLGSKLVNLELEAVQRVQKESRRSLVKLYDLMPKVVHLTKNATKVEKQKHIFRRLRKKHQKKHQEEREQQLQAQGGNETITDDGTLPALVLEDEPERWGKTIWKATKWVSKSLMVVIFGGLIIGRLEGWNLCDSVYYSLVTATTIGLGDFSPQTRGGRITAIIMIPTLVAAAGEVLAGIGLTLVERRQRKIFQSQYNKGISESYAKAMDTDGDGKVSREEYVLFMLMEMGMINQHEIDELWKQFERLDVTKSGFIDTDDLELMQKLRGLDQEATYV